MSGARPRHRKWFPAPRVGAYYRARNGVIVGPMQNVDATNTLLKCPQHGYYYGRAGRRDDYSILGGQPHEWDIEPGEVAP